MSVFFIAMLMTIIYVAYEVKHDLDIWGNVDHAQGLLRRGIVLSVISLLVMNPWPMLLFGLIFNPAIALGRKLPFFYLGETAKYDIFMRKYFGNLAGEVSFFGILILSIIAIWLNVH